MKGILERHFSASAMEWRDDVSCNVLCSAFLILSSNYTAIGFPSFSRCNVDDLIGVRRSRRRVGLVNFVFVGL